MNSIIMRDATEQDLHDIVRLSKDWEAEDITYGYAANSYETLTQYRVWSALCGNTVVGYLMGRIKVSEGMCVIPKDKIYFDIEDIYITPEFRSRGLGKALFEYVEQALKLRHVDCILLSTATKDHVKIQEFYIKKIGMTAWATTFFKNL